MREYIDLIRNYSQKDYTKMTRKPEGLLKYGYEDEAKILAEKLITLFGKDIKKCGQMHEYYDGETGEGISNEGFQSWDMLINNICAWYEKRETISEF